MALPQEPHPEIAKLLRIKRFESPPPGYFHRLPGQIRARIESDEERGSRLSSWWRDLVEPLRWRPSLAGANFLIVIGAGLLVASVGRSLLRQPDPDGTALAGQPPLFCYDIATAGPNLDRVLSSPWAGPAGGPSAASMVVPAGENTPILLHWMVNSNGSPVSLMSQPLILPVSTLPGFR